MAIFIGGAVCIEKFVIMYSLPQHFSLHEATTEQLVVQPVNSEQVFNVSLSDIYLLIFDCTMHIHSP